MKDTKSHFWVSEGECGRKTHQCQASKQGEGCFSYLLCQHPSNTTRRGKRGSAKTKWGKQLKDLLRRASDKRASRLFSDDAGACKRGGHLPNLPPLLGSLSNVFLQSFTFFAGKKKIILSKPDLFCKSIPSHVWWVLQWIKQIWKSKLSRLWRFISFPYSIQCAESKLYLFACTRGQCCATFPSAAIQKQCSYYGMCLPSEAMVFMNLSAHACDC